MEVVGAPAGLVRREVFYRFKGGAVGLNGQPRAGVDQLAVEEHRAGAAVARFAAVLHAPHAGSAQRRQEQFMRRRVPGRLFAIERKVDVHHCLPKVLAPA